MENENKYTIKSLQKALDIIDCFSLEEPELSMPMLQRRLNMDKTSIYRILVNLEERGILQRNPLTGHFRLGVIMLQYARICRAKLELREIAMPYIRELASRTEETVIINAVQENRGICIERINGPSEINIIADLGRTVPLLRGASGKGLAAFLPDEKIKAIYEAEKAQLNLSYEEIMYQVQDIRTKGYVISFGEQTPGTFGFACPIYDEDGKVNYALAVIGPAFRATEEHIKLIMELVPECAMKISEGMGYRK